MPPPPSRCDFNTAPHHSLRFHTPTAHNPYAPAAPSRYTSYAALSHPPHPLHQLPSLRSCSFLLKCLQRCSHTGLILNATYHPDTPAMLSR
ncbi:hypothetical protein O181_006014 [Austropuccinia psidii MF-1]|uniref:Uncharacterized protein n=1 Tax=Austropuccinia psidii MF-1 TaxID=1389203 RepID=A0A9Q3GGF7_9BASI|nr:hypothetical protein [Austropuccinia psidii MF-1]